MQAWKRGWYARGRGLRIFAAKFTGPLMGRPCADSQGKNEESIATMNGHTRFPFSEAKTDPTWCGFQLGPITPAPVKIGRSQLKIGLSFACIYPS
jgi:hypothetical protein